MIKTYLDNPELYFVANDDFSFNDDMPFLPMPVKDVINKDFDDSKNIVITPYIKEGFYVIKFLKNDDKIPIKISVSPFLRALIISTRSIVSISECRYVTFMPCSFIYSLKSSAIFLVRVVIKTL